MKILILILGMTWSVASLADRLSGVSCGIYDTINDVPLLKTKSPKCVYSGQMRGITASVTVINNTDLFAEIKSDNGVSTEVYNLIPLDFDAGIASYLALELNSGEKFILTCNKGRRSETASLLNCAP